MLEPVEIQLTKDHDYKKRSSGRGCQVCKGSKYAAHHFGAPPSFNMLGSGSKFNYQHLKKGLHEALALALEASDLPKGLAGVLVEGLACFPDRRKRDQGNHRVLLEKALGDVLQEKGYLANDDWDSYEFGNLQQRYEKGESWTRLVIFPR